MVRERAKAVVFKLKSELPRQQFSIAIQAAVAGKILARDDLKALKKDVLAKCYGGEDDPYIIETIILNIRRHHEEDEAVETPMRGKREKNGV